MVKKDPGELFKKLAGEDRPTEEPSNQPQTSEKPPASRPMGKSRDPNYKQLGLYVRKDIHRQVKSKAAAEEIELSELVERLLIDWLSEQSDN